MSASGGGPRRRGSSGAARVAAGLAYVVLGLACSASAVILHLSPRYGTLATAFQVVLAAGWFAAAVWTFRSVRDS